jgi:alpha/beta superfamily hydrolase
VPLAAVLDWARPMTLPVTVIPGAGHFFHGQLGLLKQLVTGAWHRLPLPPTPR